MSISRRDLAIAIFGAGAVPAVHGAKAASRVPTQAVQQTAQRVLEELKAALEMNFDTFLERASVGDLYFLKLVLDIHEGESYGRNVSTEFALPNAFQAQLDGETPCFVAVPEHLQSDAERYVKMLIASDRSS